MYQVVKSDMTEACCGRHCFSIAMEFGDGVEVSFVSVSQSI
jgi:hypothetical protein